VAAAAPEPSRAAAAGRFLAAAAVDDMRPRKPALRVADVQRAGGADGQGSLAADRERGERVGVAEVDIGEHGHAYDAYEVTCGPTLERVTRIELALSAWELDRSGSGCCVTCAATSPRVTATDPHRPGLIAR
jgi:hypothetical protein